MSPVLLKITENIVTPTIFLLIAVAVLVFIYGVFEYIKNNESEEARKIGAQHMLWGVIGLFIMVSAIGIINTLKNTFFLE